MRKILLIAFFYFLTFSGFSLDLFDVITPNMNFYLSYKYSNATSLDKSFDFSKNLFTGINLNSKLYKESLFIQDKQIANGISIYFEKLFPNIPINLYFGNYSFSGLYSKLNSPAPSSAISPFTNINTSKKTDNISPNLSQSSAFSKPNSLLFQYNFFDKSYIMQKNTFNYLIIPDFNNFHSNFIISDSAILNLNKRFSLSTTGAYGAFFVDKTNPSWYSDYPLFSDYVQALCFALKTNYITKNQIIKNIDSSTYLNFYYNPYSKLGFTFDSLFTSQIKKANCFMQIFFNPLQTITTSGKIINPQIIIKNGINQKFLFIHNTNPLIFNIGFSTYNQFLINDDFLLKQTLGINCFNKDLFLSGIISLSENTNFISAYNIQFKINSILDDFKPGINLTFSGDKSTNGKTWKTSEKINLYLNYYTDVNLSSSFALQFYQNNNKFTKIDYSASFGTNFKYKKISCNLKAGAAYSQIL